MSDAITIAGYALRESLRRRVFAVVALLTIAFLFLYRLGARKAFEETEDVLPTSGRRGGDRRRRDALRALDVRDALLGTVLAVFLTLGAVQGDAERGLLQPLVVRPLGRTTFLLGRFAGAASVCAVYVVVVYFSALLITRSAGGWTPDEIVTPALELAAAVALLVALSLLGSVLLSSTANGIAVFMLFGAGLVGGLLGQIGEALNSPTLERVAELDLAGAAVRGALPGWVAAPHRRLARVHPIRGRARPVRRRKGLRRLAAVVGGALRRRGAGRGCLLLRPARP